MHSGVYAFRDRRQKKRDFRKLWITRINAACRENEISYSRFIEGLNKAGVEVNRKMLSEIAINDPKAFTELVKVAKDGKAGKVKPASEVVGKEVTINAKKATAKKEAVKEEKVAKAEVKEEKPAKKTTTTKKATTTKTTTAKKTTTTKKTTTKKPAAKKTTKK